MLGSPVPGATQQEAHLFKNLTVYRVGPGWAANPFELEAGLEKMIFVACGATQPVSAGWAPPRGVKHAPLVESIGGQWLMKLVIEQRVLPSAVIKRSVDERAAQIEQWKAETGPVRDLYQGLLQIAVAYLQITRHNYNGAIKMFLRARQWLDPLPAVCRGVDVAQVRQEAAEARTELEKLGAERISEFDLTHLKPLRLVN